MSGQLKFSFKPELEKPTLIVSWIVDANGLGQQVTDYLNSKLDNRSFCDIEPDDFFPLHGVTIENNVIQFPESKFYTGSRKNIVVFQSPPPRFEWYGFLNMILEVADEFNVDEIYSIDSMISLAADTIPREILINFNNSEMKKELADNNLVSGWNFETPEGQRPTLNSYLLWAAQQKHMRAAAIWIPTPFYLTATGDLKAQQRVLEFFNRKFNLDMVLDDLDEKVRLQNRMIMQVRETVPEIDRLIRRVEAGENLSSDESQQLIMEMGKKLFEKKT
jgi:predicted ATP-grasp superfamily ATP-dependent carboligase